MKIILFVNDSYFSYLLAKPLLERHSDKVSAVVFSTMIKGSISKIIKIFRKSYPGYFVYRSLVNLVSEINARYNHKSVYSLAYRYNLNIFKTHNVNESEELKGLLPADLGLTFNFDQVIREDLLESFDRGVVNVHASRLPYDKGISPVLWAFARGDDSIWATIYKMDRAIDCGHIYKQFEISVEKRDTAFSLYERVCFQGGLELAQVVQSLLTGGLEPVAWSNEEEGNYWGWPDKSHRDMMKRSCRKYVALKDVLKAVRKN